MNLRTFPQQCLAPYAAYTLSIIAQCLLIYTSQKHQKKTLGFLMFSGSIDKQHRAVMGQNSNRHFPKKTPSQTLGSFGKR